MDGDFPWQYLALVVIAFLSWLFQKIQEATAERRRAKELRRRGSLPQPERRTETPVPPIVVADSLRDLMEALGGAPQKPSVPPPLPPRATPKPASKSKKTPAAEAPAQKSVPAPEAEKPVLVSTAFDEVAKAPKPLRNLLASPSGLRQAMILKEVLDKPVALR